MQCNHSGFSAAALVLAFFIAGLQKVQADCDVGTFYTPRKCQPKHVASYDWICETCPKDAIQYTSADETCVCKPRFFTEGGKYRCAEYLGNPNPTKATWPPVHDEFSCTMCDVPGDYCPGGAIWIRKDITEHQYYYEEDRSHVSGYKRVDMGVLQLRLGKYFAAEFVHAKKTFCQIYGQRMANDPWECE
jgi:ferredoxin